MSLADPTTLVDPLDKIFNDLKNKNPEVRLQSALDLRRHVGVAGYHIKVKRTHIANG